MSDSLTKILKHRGIRGEVTLLIIGGISFITALAVRDLVEAIFDNYFGPRDTITTRAIYMIVVFVIAIVLIIILSKFYSGNGNANSKNKNKKN